MSSSGSGASCHAAATAGAGAGGGGDVAAPAPPHLPLVHTDPPPLLLPAGAVVIKSDPEAPPTLVLGPVLGPMAAAVEAAAGVPGGELPAAAAAPSSPSSTAAPPQDLDLLRAVKAEPGGGGGAVGLVGLAAGKARYVALAARPFDCAELAALQSKYMEGRLTEKDMSSRTRNGTIRLNVRMVRLRPAAEGAYPQLWPHLQRLRRQVEAEAAAAAADEAAAAAGVGAGYSPGGSIGSYGGGGGGPPLSAASVLLFALRALQEHERLSGLEAGPRDAVLARVLRGYGAELAAASQAAGAAGLVGTDVVDLTADEIDIEEYLLQNPGVVAMKKIKVEA